MCVWYHPKIWKELHKTQESLHSSMFSLVHSLVLCIEGMELNAR